MQKIIYRNEIQNYAKYIDESVIAYIQSEQIETYESFDNYDLVAFDYYDSSNAESAPAQIIIYIDLDDVFYICENEQAYRVASEAFSEDDNNERAMYLFFRNLMKGGNRTLEALENHLSELDDDVTDGTEGGLREKLIEMRNELLHLKKYYEQLSFLFEEICDNDNELISAENLKYFEVLRNRCVRLHSQVMNLREYLTQIRESYTSQIGLEQNNLMKVFTMVTSIFMPLTLIVGWYGMNIKMPEFEWQYGYPFVIFLCIAVCTFWFFFFMRNKHFK